MGADNRASNCTPFTGCKTLGYTHVPGSAVNVGLRHLAPVLEGVLRPRLLALRPWLATAPGGVDAALLELRKRVATDLLPANQAFWQQVLHRSDIQLASRHLECRLIALPPDRYRCQPQ